MAGLETAAMIELHYPEGQNYDCVMCGRGCRSSWTIPVENEVAERMEKHPLGLRVINENGAAFERTPEGGYTIYYADRDHPRCGFLTPEQACTIHAELGMEAKPLTCRQFPFHLTATPDGVYVAVSFFCTSVRENSGRPLQEHEPWLLDMMRRQVRVTTIEADQVPLAEGCTTTWADFKGFDQELRARMPQQGLDLTVQQALVVAARASQENPPRLAPQWSHIELEEAPLGGQLGNVLDAALFALVKMFLDDTSRERIEALDLAYTSGDPLQLEEYRWQGSWFELLRLQDQSFGEQFEDELDRWAAMHLHRKSLLVHRPLLDNLWMLGLIPRFVRCYTTLFAHQQGRKTATSEDYYRALELAEMYLGTNGLLPTQLSPRFNQFLLQMI